LLDDTNIRAPDKMRRF